MLAAFGTRWALDHDWSSSLADDLTASDESSGPTAPTAPTLPPTTLPPPVDSAALAAVCAGIGHPGFVVYDPKRVPTEIFGATDPTFPYERGAPAVKPQRAIALLRKNGPGPVDKTSAEGKLEFYPSQVSGLINRASFELAACVTEQKRTNPRPCDFRTANGTFHATLWNASYHLSLRVTSTGAQLKAADFASTTSCEGFAMLPRNATSGDIVALDSEQLSKLVKPFVER